MVGRIMSAQQAVREYGKKYKSIAKHGNKVTLKNTEGDQVSVSKNAEVYHRGNGNFGLYSRADDEKIHKEGAKEKIGTGPYRQTHDRRRKVRKTKRR